MTRVLAGATRDGNGVRVCPLGCGPTAPIGPDGTRDTTCKAATAKASKPGERTWTAPLPGKCRMFYDEKGNPT